MRLPGLRAAGIAAALLLGACSSGPVACACATPPPASPLTQPVLDATFSGPIPGHVEAVSPTFGCRLIAAQSNGLPANLELGVYQLDVGGVAIQASPGIGGYKGNGHYLQGDVSGGFYLAMVAPQGEPAPSLPAGATPLPYDFAPSFAPDSSQPAGTATVSADGTQVSFTEADMALKPNSIDSAGTETVTGTIRCPSIATR